MTEAQETQAQAEPAARPPELPAEPAARPPELPAEPKGKPDLLARVKAERDARVAQEHILLAVPTWGGQLVARYEVVDAKDFRRRLQAGTPNVAFAAGFLNDACRGLYLRDDEGDLQRIEEHGRPVGFNTRLAEKLGMEADTVADVLLALVNGNELAIDRLSTRVLDWMTDTSQEIEGALLGESSA